MLRLELLKVKADLERELGQLVLDCSDSTPNEALRLQSTLLKLLGTRPQRHVRQCQLTSRSSSSALDGV